MVSTLDRLHLRCTNVARSALTDCPPSTHRGARVHHVSICTHEPQRREHHRHVAPWWPRHRLRSGVSLALEHASGGSASRGNGGKQMTPRSHHTRLVRSPGVGNRLMMRMYFEVVQTPPLDIGTMTIERAYDALVGTA